jgi:glycosyltransferase involved in cell wall biosynthesis
MKIGLIGNMNNNNFSLLRYFRDLGADAHLLLYAEDGQGSLSHFQPAADTWHLERWAPYIQQTAIPNTPIAALDFPLSWLMSIRSFLKAKWGRQETWVAPVSRSRIRSTYAGYDGLIASGLSPAVLQRVARRLDIFYPYAIQVEFLEAPQFTTSLHSARGLTGYGWRLLQRRQALGIRAATRVFNADPGITQETLVRHGARPLAMAIPMVYPHETLPTAPPSETLRHAQTLAREASFSALHHARLIWQNPGHWTPEEWRSENKNSQRFFLALARFLEELPAAQPRIFVVEYGPDVAATRSLVAELGLEPFVTWLPIMPRKELMWLLAQVSLAVGEFYDVPRMIWGGTGWEALASGKPILQGFQFADGEFESLYGYPAPPLLGVRTEADILAALLRVADRPADLAGIGTAARAWFDRHNGIGLARQWLEQLTNAPGSKDRSSLTH